VKISVWTAAVAQTPECGSRTLCVLRHLRDLRS
jgi:hypothetical protein